MKNQADNITILTKNFIFSDINVNTVCLPLLYPETIIEGLRVTVVGHGNTKNKQNSEGVWSCMKIILTIFKIVVTL